MLVHSRRYMDSESQVDATDSAPTKAHNVWFLNESRLEAPLASMMCAHAAPRDTSFSTLTLREALIYTALCIEAINAYATILGRLSPRGEYY